MPDPTLLEAARQLQAACLRTALTVATAESCTGGLVVGTLTAIPGSSGYVVGGIVSYANAVKEAQLGVAGDLLRDHGAVSPEVATAMADGARERLGSDLAISITGVAGPDGGTIEKPVGLTFIGLAAAGRPTAARRFEFAGDREANRRAATLEAIRWLTETAAGWS
ncbi:MAG TPA: nicotinamide-nucleotide amidohydrolase family protein [Candidatus Limnocylindrales bacterium]|nr:nicotinamide-nucleotide amidohydrolase family protein [Candidatus Limnocylindrales bacterium]